DSGRGLIEAIVTFVARNSDNLAPRAHTRPDPLADGSTRIAPVLASQTLRDHRDGPHLAAICPCNRATGDQPIAYRFKIAAGDPLVATNRSRPTIHLGSVLDGQ